jgi:hypothetical protein
MMQTQTQASTVFLNQLPLDSLYNGKHGSGFKGELSMNSGSIIGGIGIGSGNGGGNSSLRAHS